MLHKSTEAEQRQLTAFCQKHRLPKHYRLLAEEYFLPLAGELAFASNIRNPLFIGINGCQGSGKSTLADLLTDVLKRNYGKRVANLSIDDFYHTKAKRKHLAETIHPLFATRGVPGTHDVNLLQRTLDKLVTDNGVVSIPRFDKSIDDRHLPEQWDTIETPVDLVILEGWCIGATSQADSELFVPVNRLETEEDTEGIWRNTVNLLIDRDYKPLFDRLDQMIMLKAPSFDCVYEWRKKQEDKLREKAASGTDLMTETELERFIHHYQRLTENLLAKLPQTANIVFTLSKNHEITGRRDNE